MSASYERQRPAEKQHEPWVARVTGQLLAAYDGLQQELSGLPGSAAQVAMTQAGLSSAIAWHFCQQALPGLVPAERFPALAVLSAAAEALPEFRAAPYGDSTYHASNGGAA